VLRGKLIPGNLPTTYHFEYGSDTCEEGPSCVLKTGVEGPLTGETEQEVPAVEETGLAKGEYWGRLVATNAYGTVASEIVNFTVVESAPTVTPEGDIGAAGRDKKAPESESPTPPVMPLLAPVVSPPTTASPIETIKPEALTETQKLARALRACKGRPKRQRASCARRAHRRYGIAAARAGKRASRNKEQ
jgi:hypothetical protein